MKIPALLTLLLAALLAALPTRQARAEEVSFDVFYNNLADDGDWYNTPDFGYVWHPSIAEGNEKWRPYTDGYWAETDDGWTWVSYESFGWAAYHYGRWTRLKDIGWAWVPGYQWGPGWVSWRTSDDYVGWAPLPPRPEHAAGAQMVDYNDVEAADDGYTAAVDQDYDIGPDNYCFVQTRVFGAPVLSEVILPPQRNFAILENTVNVTNIYYRRGPERTVVYNSGPSFAFISAHVERPIQRLRIDRRDDLTYLRDSTRGGGNPTVVHNGVLQVAAPLIVRGPVNFAQIKPVRIKQTIERSEIVHGWTNVGGEAPQVLALRERIKQQAVIAPRQARADLPPQNVGPALEVREQTADKPSAQLQEDADRIARRDAARTEKLARDQARAKNPPKVVPNNAVQTNPPKVVPNNPVPAHAVRDGRRDQRVQEDQQIQKDQRILKDTRRDQRVQQDQQIQKDQPIPKDTRHDQRVQTPDQPIQKDQPTQKDTRRDQRAQAPDQPIQKDQPTQKDTRRDQRVQPQTQTVQPTQPPQKEREVHRAERPAPAPAAPQGSPDDDKKKKHDN